MRALGADRESIRRVLVIKLSAIGDVVLATPVAAALRRHFPAAHISWLVEDRMQAILAGNPHIDEAIVWRRTECARRWSQERRRVAAVREQLRFAAELRRRRFDLVVDAQGSLKSVIFTLATGAPRRIGGSGWREGRRLAFTHSVPMPEEDSGLYAPDRYLHLLHPLGIYEQGIPTYLHVGPEEKQFARRFRAEQGLAESAPVVSFCPATSPAYRTKLWIPRRWAQVADRLQRDGLRVLLHGAPADLPLIDSIVREMQTAPVIAAGRTRLLEAAALLKESLLCVATETGLQHFAVAVGTPVVVLLGPTLNTPPAPHRALRTPYPCQPCRRKPTCQFREGAGECLAAITAADVLAACHDLLSRRAQAGDARILAWRRTAEAARP